MHLFFLHPQDKERKTDFTDDTQDAVYKPPTNTAEGSEFLDDALRMKEQPLSYTDPGETDDSGWVKDPW